MLRFIQEFWAREIEEAEQANEITAEQFAYERLNDLLSVSDFKEYANEITVHDHWAGGTPSYSFNTLADLRKFLLQQAEDASNAGFPSNEDDRQPYERAYNNERLVEKVLAKYAKELIILNWI